MLSRTLLKILVVLLLCGSSFGAVAFDAVANATGQTGSGTLTASWTHTIVSGTNGFIVVACGFGGVTADTGVTMSATMDGSAMTAGSAVHENASASGFIQYFWAVGAASGARSMVGTATGGSSRNVADTLVCGSVSATGANQVTPIAHNPSATGTGAAPSVAVTSAVGNLVIDLMGTGLPESATGQTIRWVNNFASTSAGGNVAQSSAAGAASVTMSYTTGADWWAIIGLDIAAAAGGSASPNLTIKGKVVVKGKVGLT